MLYNMASIHTILLFSLLGIIAAKDTVTNAAVRTNRPDVRLRNYIHYKLKQGGEPDVRPAGKNHSALTEVELRLTLTDIIDFDDDTGILKAMAWVHMGWKDANVGWNLPRFGNINTMRLLSDKFWVPDMMLYNSLDGKTDFDASVRLAVTNDGKVTIVPPVKLKTRCGKHNTTSWKCEWKFGSWTYSALDVNLKDEPVFDVKYLKDQKTGWTVSGEEAVRNSRKYDCCPEQYQHVLFKLFITPPAED